MDYQNRVGSKFGGGGVAGKSETNMERRERLRKLAMETIDLTKDPYYFRNHLGQIECKLCTTMHTNDGSYLSHTQGKKHQQNLARRAAIEAKERSRDSTAQLLTVSTGAQVPVTIRKNVLKIGRPGYKITKIRDQITRAIGLSFQLQYPEIGTDIKPRMRFMSAYEQHQEPHDRNYQYLLVAAEPYETVAFKIQSREIDKNPERFFSYWDPDGRNYTVQFFYKTEREERYAGVPGVAHR